MLLSSLSPGFPGEGESDTRSNTRAIVIGVVRQFPNPIPQPLPPFALSSSSSCVLFIPLPSPARSRGERQSGNSAVNLPPPEAAAAAYTGGGEGGGLFLAAAAALAHKLITAATINDTLQIFTKSIFSSHFARLVSPISAETAAPPPPPFPKKNIPQQDVDVAADGDGFILDILTQILPTKPPLSPICDWPIKARKAAYLLHDRTSSGGTDTQEQTLTLDEGNGGGRKRSIPPPPPRKLSNASRPRKNLKKLESWCLKNCTTTWTYQ